MVFGLSYTLWVNIIFTLGIAAVVISFALPAIRGAMYAPTSPEVIRAMLSLLQVQPGTHAIDIGSGDGRIVIALAKAGAYADGVESNLFLVLWSRYCIRKAGVSDRAHVYWRSFWRMDLSQYHSVTLFGIFYIMRGLEEKLQKELPSGARVVSNYFQFPRWKPAQGVDGVHLYEKT